MLKDAVRCEENPMSSYQEKPSLLHRHNSIRKVDMLLGKCSVVNLADGIFGEASREMLARGKVAGLNWESSKATNLLATSYPL